MSTGGNKNKNQNTNLVRIGIMITGAIVFLIPRYSNKLIALLQSYLCVEKSPCSASTERRIESELESTVRQRVFVAEFIHNLASMNIPNIAKSIEYPLIRQFPLPPITNEGEFIANYGHYFDSQTIELIKASEGNLFSNWRGTTIGDGLIWFVNSKIISINLLTASGKRQLQEAIESDKLMLNHAARNYDRVQVFCKTKKFTVRVHQKDNHIFYFSWNNEDSMLRSPRLIINGGNHDTKSYIFRKANFEYLIYMNDVCDRKCEAHLAVFRDSQEILNQVCEKFSSSDF